ncbi:3-deoxy-D-arabinoheptulosonate-7-phosphate synthase [Salmonella enterica subsp. enterica]|nr:3-deoxy-D-arabinoheptulosonate-7-phosphate synthase [Salmonella enterica subsp. enterica]
MNRTDELRTARIDSLVTPTELAQRYPVSSSVASHVYRLPTPDRKDFKW